MLSQFSVFNIIQMILSKVSVIIFTVSVVAIYSKAKFLLT